MGLPKVDGLTLLRRWREAGLSVPVLVLTARASWHEKVQGIDGGADDYVAKPFRMEEVLARLRALIRRASGHLQPELRCGPVVLDPRAAKVTLDGVPVKLTSHEFRVLSYLMHQRGRVVSQSELTEHIYAHDADRGSNTVEVFIARLRRKLGAGFIETVRGLGYRPSLMITQISYIRRLRRLRGWDYADGITQMGLRRWDTQMGLRRWDTQMGYAGSFCRGTPLACPSVTGGCTVHDRRDYTGGLPTDHEQEFLRGSVALWRAFTVGSTHGVALP